MQADKMFKDCNTREMENQALFYEEQFIDFNIVLKQIGGLKRYQVMLVTVMYLVTIPSGLNIFGSVFLEATPEHWCTMPSKENPCQNLTFLGLKKYFIPFDNKTQSFGACLQYNHTLTSNQTKSCQRKASFARQINTISCQRGNSFNKSVLQATVVTEWNLVCSRSVLKTIADSVFFFGIMVGGILGGYYSDRYGRVSVMTVSLIIWVGFGIGLSYAPSFIAYVSLRFVVAACLQVTYLCGFVYVMEISGDKWRTFSGVCFDTFYGIAGGMSSVFAFLLQNWRKYQFFISLFPILIICCLTFVPESPRWLFSKGKNKKAKLICEKMAKKNGKPLPTDVWKNAKICIETSNIHFDHQKDHNMLDLFKRTKIRLLTIKLVYLWFSVSLVYYGLIFNVGNLTGNIFVNNALNALMETIGNIFVIFTMDRFGRKPLLFGSLLLAAVCCLVAALLQGVAGSSHVSAIFVTVMSVLGIMAIAASFAVMYNYTAELYPTVIRSIRIQYLGVRSVVILVHLVSVILATCPAHCHFRSNGMAAGNLGARTGAMITPFVLFLHKVYPWTTGAIFGTASISAAIIALFLPETLNKPILTSIEDTENFLSNNSKDTEQTS